MGLLKRYGVQSNNAVILLTTLYLTYASSLEIWYFRHPQTNIFGATLDVLLFRISGVKNDAGAMFVFCTCMYKDGLPPVPCSAFIGYLMFYEPASES